MRELDHGRQPGYIAAWRALCQKATQERISDAQAREAARKVVPLVPRRIVAGTARQKARRWG